MPWQIIKKCSVVVYITMLILSSFFTENDQHKIGALLNGCSLSLFEEGYESCFVSLERSPFGGGEHETTKTNSRSAYLDFTLYGECRCDNDDGRGLQYHHCSRQLFGIGSSIDEPGLVGRPGTSVRICGTSP